MTRPKAASRRSEAEDLQPDPQYKAFDPRTGKPMFVYSLEYKLPENDKDETWEFRFWAYDLEDAVRRAEAIRASATLLGQVLRDDTLP